MNETVSNKTLVVLLIVAIGVSVMGIWVSVSNQDSVYLSGAATSDTGTAQIEVSSLISAYFSDSLINSTLTITDDSVTRVHANTNGTCLPTGNCTIDTDGFVFENNGNQNVSVNVTTDFADATSVFSTASAAGIGITVTNNEASSCASGLADASDVTNASSQQVCGVFLSDDASDTLNMYVNFNVSSSEPAGVKGFTVTATIA